MPEIEVLSTVAYSLNRWPMIPQPIAYFLAFFVGVIKRTIQLNEPDRK